MPSDQLTSFIAEVKTQIDQRLEKFYDARILLAAKLDTEYEQLVREMKKLTLRGGKRLRPAMAVLGYQLCGGSDESAMLDAALALEIFHNYLLIHDDIMDRDERRHGGLNITGVYARKYMKVQPPQLAVQTATTMAILAGDINCGLAYEAIMEAPISDMAKLAATRRLNQAVFEVACGQQLDVLASFSTQADEEAIMKIDLHKTAGYSVVAPLQFGALVAGAKNGQLELLAEYGQQAGIAFQLADDLLGIFGNSKSLGKSVLSDLQEGKQTLLMHNGFALANTKQKQRLQSVYGKLNANSSDLALVKQILIDCGAKAKTLEMAQAQVAGAIATAHKISGHNNEQQLLIDFAQYCLDRTV